MHKRILSVFVLLVCVFALVACGSSSVTVISAKTGKEMMENQQVIVVDVREQYEYDSGHIEGAILLPVGDIDSKAESLLVDKDATIIVYCRSGRRSAEAANKLAKLGFTNIYDMGGILDWTNQGFKTV